MSEQEIKESQAKDVNLLSEEAKKRCAETMAKLEDHMAKFDPLDLLAHIMVPSFFGQTPDSDFQELPMLNLAFNLAIKPSSVGTELPNPEVSGNAVECLREYCRHEFGASMYEHGPSEISETIAFAKNNAFIELVNAQMYQFQIDSENEKLLKPLDADFKAAFGFGSEDLNEVFDRIFSLYNERFGARAKSADSARKKIEEMSDKDFYQMVKGEKVDKNEFAIKTGVYELFFDFKKAFTFKVDDLVKVDDSDQFKEMLGKLLETIAIKHKNGNPGYKSLTDKDMSNVRPIIQFEGDKYIFGSLRGLKFFQRQTWEELLENEKNQQSRLWHKYEKARSEYTQNAVIACFKTIAPKAEILSNVFYDFGGKQNEVDLLVRYDDKIILCEVKAGGFSQAAKEGRAARLKSELGKLVGKAFHQTLLARDYLAMPGPATFTNANRQKIELEIPEKEKPSHIFLICVTLENLQSLLTDLNRVKNLGLWTDPSFPWAVSLYELEVIARHSPSPSVFFHYLEQRQDAHKDSLFVGPDELTYFAWYLKTGAFRFVELPEATKVFIDTAWIEEFDQHYLNNKPAPKYNTPPLMKRFIEEFEDLEIPGHSSIISRLLNLGPPVLAELFDKISMMIELTKKDGKEHSVTMYFEKPFKAGVVFISWPRREGLDERVAQFAYLKKYQMKADYWIGLGRATSESNWLLNVAVLLGMPWELDEGMERAVAQFEEHRARITKK